MSLSMACLPSFRRKLYFYLIPKSKNVRNNGLHFLDCLLANIFALIQKCFKAILISRIALYRLSFTRSSPLRHCRIEVLIKHIQNGDTLSYIDRPKIFSIPTP